MKLTINNLASVVSFILLVNLFQCANPIVPSGGPKDTIPPTLVQSIPSNQSTRFKGDEITLAFDEKVAAEKIRQNLIITPTLETKYKTFVKKNTVKLTFEKPFPDSTTYTLNFFNGITDITEKNPAENLIIAFSTGRYIDSLQVGGFITNLFTGAPQEKMTVGLYPTKDTLTYQERKPMYFMTTDKEGYFKISNIKDGKYRLLSFNDKNNNLLFNPSEEEYAFSTDTLNLTHNFDSLRLQSIQVDATPLDIISARAFGRYFEIKYTKPITYFVATHPDSTTFVPASITSEQNKLRFYPKINEPYTDSTQVYVYAKDSLNNHRLDTIFIKFKESSKSPENYTTQFSSKNSEILSSNNTYRIDFNKPTHIQDSAFAFIPIDTLINLPVPLQQIRLNPQHTSISFKTSVTLKHINDTIAGFISTLKLDSTDLDSTHLLIQQQLTTLTNPKNIPLKIKAGAFLSTELDTSQVISTSFKVPDPTQYALLIVNVATDAPSYFIQVMQNDKPVKTLQNCKQCKFDNLKPGDYWIRVLEDTNIDGFWSIGNILQNSAPEPAHFFKEKTTVRANWEITLDIQF